MDTPVRTKQLSAVRGQGRKPRGVTRVGSPCSKALERAVALGEMGRAVSAACHFAVQKWSQAGAGASLEAR